MGAPLDSELEALLRGEGRLDSSGSFTLDASKAKVKLGRFHLPPGLWVASLVQAGVAAGCGRIDFNCKDMLLGRGTRVIYRGMPSRTFNLDAIMKGLSEPLSLPAGSPEAYLTEGILASASAPAWLRVGKSGREVLRQRGEEVECWRSSDGGAEKAELELDAELPVSVLRSRCAFSPVAVWIGGDRLQPRWDSPMDGVVFHIAVQYCGGSQHPLALPPFRPPMVRDGSTGSVAADPLDEGVFLERVVGEPPWDVGILLPATLPERVTIQWVRHGAVVETETRDLFGCPGCRIIASTEGLATDLTRYQLVKDERYHQRLLQLADQVLELRRALHKQYDRLRVPDHSFGAADTAVTFMAGSGAAFLGLAAAGVASWPVGILGMCCGAPLVGYLAFKKMRARLERQTTERVKRTLWPEGPSPR